MPIKLSSMGVEFGNTSRAVTTSSDTGGWTSSTVDVVGPQAAGIWYQDQPNPGMPSPWWGRQTSTSGWTGTSYIKVHHYGYYYTNIFNTSYAGRVFFYPIYIDTGANGDKYVKWLEINVSAGYSFNSGGGLKAALYDIDRGNYHSSASRLQGSGFPKARLCEFDFTSVATSTGTKSVNGSTTPLVYRGWYFLGFWLYNYTAGTVRGSYGGSGSYSATLNSYGPYIGSSGAPTNYPSRAFNQTISSATTPSIYSPGSNGSTYVTPYFAIGLEEV